MSLEELIDDSKKEVVESLQGDEEEEKHFGVKADHEKLRDNSLCPNCGSDNTERKEYYWRCKEPRSECETITFINSSYSIKAEEAVKMVQK